MFDVFICLRFNGYVYHLRFDEYVFVYVSMDMYIYLRFDEYVHLFMFGRLESRDMMERVVVRVYGY